jgi:hypothetical protein
MPLEITLNNDEKVRVRANPVDKNGSPAKLDGTTVETVSGDATVTQIDDTSFDIVASKTAGDSVVTVSGDADLGAGVVTLTDTVTVHTVTPAAPMATSLGLTNDAPVKQ